MEKVKQTAVHSIVHVNVGCQRHWIVITSWWEVNISKVWKREGESWRQRRKERSLWSNSQSSSIAIIKIIITIICRLIYISRLYIRYLINIYNKPVRLMLFIT